MPSPLEHHVEQQPDIKLPAPVFETVAAAGVASAPANPSASDPQQAAVKMHARRRPPKPPPPTPSPSAVWTITGDAASIQTELSKTMLPVVLNADAAKILRAALRDAGIFKFTLLPGAATPAAAKKPRGARTGSVHAKALEHPMVQQAQKLFDAEIQTVIDLRDND